MTRRSLYEYVGSLTRPVTIPVKNREIFMGAQSSGTFPARSALGAPERGAGSPNGLTEGFYTLS